MGTPVDFYLADYRFSNNLQDYIIGDWQTVNLSSLSGASKLQFSFDSSDVGLDGINTPTYVAVDNLVVTPIPEPSTWAALSVALVTVYVVRRRATCALLLSDYC